MREKKRWLAGKLGSCSLMFFEEATHFSEKRFTAVIGEPRDPNQKVGLKLFNRSCRGKDAV